jgi:hypothetical protein
LLERLNRAHRGLGEGRAPADKARQQKRDLDHLGCRFAFDHLSPHADISGDRGDFTPIFCASSFEISSTP